MQSSEVVMGKQYHEWIPWWKEYYLEARAGRYRIAWEEYKNSGDQVKKRDEPLLNVYLLWWVLNDYETQEI